MNFSTSSWNYLFIQISVCSLWAIRQCIRAALHNLYSSNRAAYGSNSVIVQHSPLCNYTCWREFLICKLFYRPKSLCNSTFCFHLRNYDHFQPSFVPNILGSLKWFELYYLFASLMFQVHGELYLCFSNYRLTVIPWTHHYITNRLYKFPKQHRKIMLLHQSKIELAIVVF